MRLLILTQYYPPEFGAVAVRLSRLARMLAANGHTVTVLTGMPNYPTGVIPEAYRRHVIGSETLDGVQVRRVWVYASPSKRTRSRLLNQISFMVMTALYGTCLPRPDVILVESHPLFVCLAGGWLHLLKRSPVVLNVSDLWPESAVAIGALRADSLLVKLASRVERWAYRSAAHVIGMTAGVCKGILSVLQQSDRVTLIQNAVDLEQFRPGLDAAGQAMRQKLNLANKFVVSHIGNMSLAHDFDLILDAAAALPVMAFVLAGGGSQAEYIRRGIERRGLTNVTLTGVLPHQDMPGLWAATDVCLIAFKNHPLFSGALPSKMFEAFATGTPVVAAVTGEAEELLAATGAGVAVLPSDCPALVEALRSIQTSSERQRQMGRAGRAYAEAHLAPERVKQAYLDIFRRVAAPD